MKVLSLMGVLMHLKAYQPGLSPLSDHANCRRIAYQAELSFQKWMSRCLHCWTVMT